MKVTHNNIKAFLFTPGKYFVIPDFQRPYSWVKENIDFFLIDLEEVMNSGKNHFFGSVVYINEGDNSVIIDGQQRATTVLLMLTALYHIVEKDPSKSAISAEQIKESYLFNKYSYCAEENRIKLKTVTTDNEIFERIFENQQLDERSKESRLFRAYTQFYDYFVKKNMLEIYINTLERFEIVTIALDSSDDNPQKVFESINSTGKPLSDGDKIRNFALMLNDKNARQIVLEKYWNKIERCLTDVSKDYITDFFRNYLTSTLQKEVKLEQVYPEFKRAFERSIDGDQSNIVRLEEFYTNIVTQLDHYLFLKFNLDEGSRYLTVKNTAFRLNFLKIEIIYPFLIKVLDQYSKDLLSAAETQRVFSIVESFLARRIICNFATTGLNNLFSILHKEIENYLANNPEESYSNILSSILLERSGATHIPSNAEVELAVRTSPFYTQRNYYNNFILSSIDDFSQSKESALLKQIANGDVDVSIEHIMPQTLNREWKEMLGSDYQEIHDQYVHTLAKLTLTGYNSKYSNKDFDIKKSMEKGFDQSPLLINRYIKEKKKWDKSALDGRASWWTEQIEKIWPLPTTTFKAPSEDVEYLFKTDDDLTYTKVKSVSVLGETTNVSNWTEACEIIIEKFFKENPNLYDFVVGDEFLSRYIRVDGSQLIKSIPIKDTVYFLEGGTNTNYKKMIVRKLTEYLDIDESDLKVVLVKPSGVKTGGKELNDI